MCRLGPSTKDFLAAKYSVMIFTSIIFMEYFYTLLCRWVPVYSDPSQRLAVMSIGFLLGSRDDAVVWRGPKKNGVFCSWWHNTSCIPCLCKLWSDVYAVLQIGRVSLFNIHIHTLVMTCSINKIFKSNANPLFMVPVKIQIWGPTLKHCAIWCVA